MHRAHRSGLAAVCLLGAIFLVSACGGSQAPNPAGVSPAASPGSVQTAEPTGSASGSDLVEVATDNKFSPTSYTIKAGVPYTLRLDNKGAAIHNWHILGAKGSDGKEITGAIVDPGKSDTLRFAVSQPGTYRFICDVHPDEMKGTLTVQ